MICPTCYGKVPNGDMPQHWATNHAGYVERSGPSRDRDRRARRLDQNRRHKTGGHGGYQHRPA